MKNIGSLMKLQNLVLQRLPNPPFSLNKDYTQIYNIPAEKTGTSPTLANEGAVAIYRRLRDGTYRFNIRLYQNTEQQTETLDLKLQ